MPSTHLSLHYHIVFSTKERREFIAEPWRERLHAYLGGCLRTLHGIPEAIGGTKDHVHILAGLRATHALADVIRDIKRPTTEWMHEGAHMPDFRWQDGYGGFTVSASDIPQVKAYIAQQDEHHRKKTFQEEYVEFLKANGIEYKEEFLW